MILQNLYPGSAGIVEIPTPVCEWLLAIMSDDFKLSTVAAFRVQVIGTTYPEPLVLEITMDPGPPKSLSINCIES